MQRIFIILIIVTILIVGCKGSPESINAEYKRPVTLAKYDTIRKESYKEPIGPETNILKYYGKIGDGETLSVALLKTGIEYKIAEQIILNLKGIFDFKKCKPEDSFVISLDKKSMDLISFSYSSSPVDNYIIERKEDGKYTSYKEEYEVEKRIEFITGRVQGSLYETMEKIGEDPQLSVILANEVLAWDIDFYTEVMPDDEFKIIVEKYYSGNYFIQYGKVLAAIYNGKSTGNKEAFYFLYDKKGKKGGYYNSKGLASRRAFLKSPLKYGKITSRFGMRFHPIYKKFKMHHGVDYGAPIGTQVWAVADGIVSFAGVMGGYGKLIILKHKGGLETRYGHLSRFGAGIRQGKSVEQGRLIGYVGSTGVSTGPHLHFEMRQNGKLINPLKRVAPPSEPLDKKYLAEFQRVISEYRKYFDLTEKTVISTELIDESNGNN